MAAEELLHLVPYLDETTKQKKDVHLIYDMGGKKYYCPKNSFPAFAHYFIRLPNKDHCLTMDLSSTPVHTLILDIDVKYENEMSYYGYIRSCMEYIDMHCISVLRSQFLCFKNFTMVIALRENGGGLHLHFPEILIAHDDYNRLCSKLKLQFEYKMRDVGDFSLDILTNSTLANSMKPNMSKYEPKRMMYFDDNNIYSLNFVDSNYPKQLDDLKKKFKKRKNNSRSFFRQLLFHKLEDIIFKLKEYMMPIPVVDAPLYRLSYPTLITKEEMEQDEEEDEVQNYERVASFTYKKKYTMYIYKGDQFLTNGEHWQRSYYFLKFNAFTISDFESSYHALNTWYDRSRSISAALTEDAFLGINETLREDNYKLSEDKNPIKTILEFQKGYFFLPVFYALCQYLKMSSKTLIQHLRGILDNHVILDALDQIDSKLIDNISRDFTLDTILFCGSNMITKKCTRMRDFIDKIVYGMRKELFSATTSDQLVEHIRYIQERHLPIVVASLRHSCKKPVRYMWNCIYENWQEVSNQTEIQNLINTIWSTVLTFLKKNGSKEMYENLKEVNVSYIVSAVSSETNIDRQVIEMDRHKWLIRMQHGILDLLTGHVGGTVPQYFMSDRRFGVSFDRPLLLNIRQNRQDIVSTYHLLTRKSFFQSYLKKLFMDNSDDLMDTLREKVREEDNIHLKDNSCPLIESMLQMYVHLCKYTSFDYDRLMFLLDVTTSLLIATNYPRKFFIFKGETRNGKSKFFQMLSKVFGGYSHTIRSVNLQAGNSNALVAQPELASSLFNCRIVMVEELSGKLNENLVKEITGNSSTSFRNLYEQHTGGIPTAKLFASTNTVPVCTATEAFKDRVIAFPYESEFTKEANYLKTSDQVKLNKYPLDTSDSVIDDSYKGFFLLMYQHFIHNVDSDGTIKYRPEPLSLQEFKAEFLLMTDIFVQFKQYADIQIMAGCMTTFNELKSAIRQYLKHTRNTSTHESDLLIRFDEEFGHLKKTDMQLDAFSGNLLDEEEEGEEEEEEDVPKRKKIRLEKSCIVYYENVVIKNIKKEKTF